MNINKIAIIGANGFIGSNLAKKLQESKDNVITLFGRSEKAISNTTLPYKKIDLSNTNQIIEDFNDIDFIYFLASETIPATSWNNPKLEITNNLLPFIVFLEAISGLDIKKIIFVSSAGTIYGSSNLQVDEDAVKNPFSPYGITKLTMEYYLNYFDIRSNLKYDIYRVSNVYGEGQNVAKGLGIINTFLEKIITEHKIQIFGNGENIRNYIYVQDLVTLMSHSVSANTQVSNIFNASSNDTMSINELVTTIKDVVIDSFEIEYTATRQSDNSAIFLSNRKLLANNPGFEFTSIAEGIKKTYDHIKKNIL